MKNKTKEQILSALEGKFEVTKVEREDWDEGVGIICEFIKKGKTGKFTYTLEGGERGVDSIDDYDEIGEEDEDIYSEAFDWVQENVEWGTTIKCDGKEVK